MALRRPALLVCLTTIVLGLNFEEDYYNDVDKLAASLGDVNWSDLYQDGSDYVEDEEDEEQNEIGWDTLPSTLRIRYAYPRVELRLARLRDRKFDSERQCDQGYGSGWLISSVLEPVTLFTGYTEDNDSEVLASPASTLSVGKIVNFTRFDSEWVTVRPLDLRVSECSSLSTGADLGINDDCFSAFADTNTTACCEGEIPLTAPVFFRGKSDGCYCRNASLNNSQSGKETEKQDTDSREFPEDDGRSHCQGSRFWFPDEFGDFSVVKLCISDDQAEKTLDFEKLLRIFSLEPTSRFRLHSNTGGVYNQRHYVRAYNGTIVLFVVEACRGRQMCTAKSNLFHTTKCCQIKCKSLPLFGLVGRGCFKDSKKAKLQHQLTIASLVFTVAMSGDKRVVQTIKPIMHAVSNGASIRRVVQTALKGQAYISDKVKGDSEGNTPLWKRYSTFTPRPSFTFTVYPAMRHSFLPGLGSSGRHNMAYLGCRLGSLVALPESCNISRSRLAQAGFFYDSSNTSRDSSNMHEVVCHSCGLTWARWEAGDNPMVMHRRMRPDCEYIKNQDPDIFPQDPSPHSSVSSGSSLSSSSTSSTDSSMSGLSSVSFSTLSSSSSSGSSQASSVMGAAGSGRSDLGDLATDCAGIAPAPLSHHGHVTASSQSAQPTPGHSYSSLISRTAQLQLGSGALNPLPYLDDQDDRPPLCLDSAVYPQFSTISERLATYDKWPLGQYFKPDDLVYDGFYYAGYADCLRCFYCGVGLKSWDRNDSVLDEHIRWRPSCGFIQAVKGRRFVQRTLHRLGVENTNVHSQPASNNTNPQGSSASVRDGAGNPAPTLPPVIASALAPAPTPSNATTSTQQTVPSRDAREAARGMGFSEELIQRATRDLQQPGVPTIEKETFIEYLIDLTSAPEANQTQFTANSDLHTDGAHALEPNPLSDRAQQVLRENERLRGLKTCKICHRGTVGVIFLPCGHLLACTDCASRTRNCTRCGQYIRATANVYLS